MTGSNQGEITQLYRFRELHFICRDNQIIHPHRPTIEVYADIEQAEINCKHWQLSYRYLWNDWPGGFPVHKVESFRLVHSSLYDKILKPWDADAHLIK